MKENQHIELHNPDFCNKYSLGEESKAHQIFHLLPNIRKKQPKYWATPGRAVSQPTGIFT